ncbi:Uncharacterised protein [Salmonella enterica subsp. enterica serovar Typhimurium str. DT104]|nr:Uncharacterised protein [Salmonella enterica subsp. enterica serovar Typhimurium str. DT104]CNO37206.1 Uncharacterised protein [Salmonella enterica subsp. enterica serovar Typhimurium str. DT104]CNO95820.1 Uncharacterised protein [Salmonella enterica subsp. enterica serovar Typhimurium str. DT104]CNP65830.1 Uncharacterised protein [Salmonella enterica subsp. enterica serovar Typhimurium str. DT104]CNP70800.1 Uncharacterised protein [Salmonella enterica subsp. enterica serovar Typhimurium str
MPADIRIFRSQLSIRRQGKCRRIPATGNGRRAQVFQELLIHDYLVALHDESGRLVSVCRVNISNAIRRHQELAYLPVRHVFHAQSKSGHIIFAVFGLLYFDAPHGVPFIVSILPLLRKLLQFAGVILRQFHLLQQFLTQVTFSYLPFEKIQIACGIVAGLPGRLHECGFTDLIYRPDIKIVIPAGPDIHTGRYPVQRRSQISCGVFHLMDIRNLRV